MVQLLQMVQRIATVATSVCNPAPQLRRYIFVSCTRTVNYPCRAWVLATCTLPSTPDVATSSVLYRALLCGSQSTAADFLQHQSSGR